MRIVSFSETDLQRFALCISAVPISHVAFRPFCWPSAYLRRMLGNRRLRAYTW
jgi:hypothetical protein